MLFLAVLTSIIALITTGLVAYANGMSSSPSTPFQGKVVIIAVWIVAAVLWMAWGIG